MLTSIVWIQKMFELHRLTEILPQREFCVDRLAFSTLIPKLQSNFLRAMQSKTAIDFSINGLCTAVSLKMSTSLLTPNSVHNYIVN